MTAMWAGGGRYHQWVDFLDRWAAGELLDPAVLPALSTEDLSGDSWERLGNRLSDAVSRRLKGWAGALSKGIADARDDFGVARALAQARLGLGHVRALPGHAGLPADVAQRLLEMVDRQVRSMQESLERQVDQLRRAGEGRDAVEGRLRTIRDNPLTAVTAQPAVTARVDSWYVDPSAPGRRRVIPTDRTR